jgi:hypothetical protein
MAWFILQPSVWDIHGWNLQGISISSVKFSIALNGLHESHMSTCNVDSRLAKDGWDYRTHLLKENSIEIN